MRLVFTLFLLYATVSYPLAVPHRRQGMTGSDQDSETSQPDSTEQNTDSASSSSKHVVAHFIVGNADPYTVSTWKKDIELALSKGIDGFALNVGEKSPEQVVHAFEAAKGTDFKLFFSFDMSTMACDSSESGGTLRKYLKDYLHHPNYFTYHSKRLVSTFSGEKCTFGRSLSDGWESVVKKGFSDVYFMPSFMGDPKKFSDLEVVDGLFSWDSSWPRGNSKPSFTPDEAYFAALGKKGYMAPVSPWFFTHYGADSYNKNNIYNFDDWLWAARWDILFKNRERLDLVQIISWNDYGESHYIGPIEGKLPDSQAWTKGFPHTDWLELAEYYIKTFKNGKAPSISNDQIFLWSRLYRADATASSDSLKKPDDAQAVDDILWSVVLLQDPAEVTLSCGEAHTTQNCEAGASKLKLTYPKSGSCQVKAAISKGHSLSPNGFIFGHDPKTYNFNAFVASSST